VNCGNCAQTGGDLRGGRSVPSAVLRDSPFEFLTQITQMNQLIYTDFFDVRDVHRRLSKISANLR
jgi:hypothetical protein